MVNNKGNILIMCMTVNIFRERFNRIKDSKMTPKLIEKYRKKISIETFNVSNIIML